MFDCVTVTFQAGNGGDGCVSFRREKFVPHGGPDGGAGGDGGSVILIATAEVNDFSEFRNHQIIRAKNGGPGQSGKRFGKRGVTRYVKIPIGTIVRSTEFDGILRECTKEGETLEIVRGGRGGKGNLYFASSINQVPYEYEEGKSGETITVTLDLKMIADIGLIGFPNAGKSTLLHALTGAKPKIADYPFTTLEPKQGILIFDNYTEAVVADIPGIIRDASSGVGLGNQFLKHVERTGVLVHVVECEPYDMESPLECYRLMRKELEQYSDILRNKPEIIVLNKIDTYPDFYDIINSFKKEHLSIIPLSARESIDLDVLKHEIQILVEAQSKKSDTYVPEL